MMDFKTVGSGIFVILLSGTLACRALSGALSSILIQDRDWYLVTGVVI